MSKQFYFKQFFLARSLLVKTVLFQVIQFSINMQFSSIWPLDRTLSGASTPGQSGPGKDGSVGVLRIPESFSITGTSPSDCSYPGHLLRVSYPSAKMQLVYFDLIFCMNFSFYDVKVAWFSIFYLLLSLFSIFYFLFSLINLFTNSFAWAGCNIMSILSVV